MREGSAGPSILGSPQNKAPQAGAKVCDLVVAAQTKREQGRGERVGFGGGGKNNRGEQGAHGGLTGARIEDVPQDFAFGLEGFAPDGGDRNGFVAQGDDGEEGRAGVPARGA